MWFNPLSAALLYGLLSTTIVVAQTGLPTGFPPASASAMDTLSPASTASQGQGLKGGSGTGNNRNLKEGASAMDTAAQGSTTPTAGSARPSSAKSSSNTGAIAGGVIGGVLFLLLVGALLLFLRKRRRTRDQFGSEEKSADETAANYDGPSLPPVPPAAASESPHPHHSPAAPNEAHALMSHYGDTQPQQMPQEVQPVIMPAKPYDVNSSSREIRGSDEDDDGVSINSPSPVTTPSPERQQEQQRSVPRLPIYQGGRRDDVGGDTPPPAL
ncbi:unnamed protein product [Tuber melanosporum]|uniref:(Perigord truffle) hypothetical protein n=1 Tax=Tuber melanosporum (strain Mel28) TaxID=656061 RepID=D5GDH8_TUBMM|nr:uncharacterized protein GSTUM_00001027001 [Tuber melanosporum]CAZ82571.1 unnamed protein product [Tuber melanosporum]